MCSEKIKDEVQSIYEKYIDSKGRINPKKIVNISEDEIRCLRKYLCKLPTSYNPTILLQHIKYHVYEVGNCKKCGNPTKWLKNHYQEYCCMSCMQKSELVKENRKKTNVNKFGVSTNLQIEDVKNLAKKNSHTKEALDKQHKTNLKVHGWETPFQNESILRNALEKSHNDDSNEKRNNTILRKYGSPIISLDRVKEKIFEKYKVDNYAKSNKFRKFMSRLALSEEFQSKINDSKRKNHTFNTSKPEEELFLYIKERFPSVERQHRDKERYPFNCDFYIPELDMFIELQGSWTHGKHPYNPFSIEDQLTLEKWKSKQKRYYDNAIRCWTTTDVEKRNCAKENNLNFKEVWSLGEGKKFIDNLFEKTNIN